MFNLKELEPWLITAHWLLRLGWFLIKARRPKEARFKRASCGRLHFAGVTLLLAVEANRNREGGVKKGSLLVFQKMILYDEDNVKTKGPVPSKARGLSQVHTLSGATLCAFAQSLQSSLTLYGKGVKLPNSCSNKTLREEGVCKGGKLPMDGLTFATLVIAVVALTVVAIVAIVYNRPEALGLIQRVIELLLRR